MGLKELRKQREEIENDINTFNLEKRDASARSTKAENDYRNASSKILGAKDKLKEVSKEIDNELSR